jgi:hypothetical protein
MLKTLFTHSNYFNNDNCDTPLDVCFINTMLQLNINNIPIESDYIKKKNEEFDPIKEIENIALQLASYETQYIFGDNKGKILPRLYLTIYFIDQARKAIDKLEEVDKNNKKYSYYESNKNASVEDLITLYKNKLEANNEHKLSTIASKSEILLKLIITTLKKEDPILVNILSFFFIEGYTGENKWYSRKFKPSYDNRLLIDDLIDFFGVGHVTKNAIYKSTAIYIFELYRNTSIEKEKLKELIDLLFIYSFGIDKYTNFSNFDTENYYIKNIVYPFYIFDTNKKLKEEQTLKGFAFYKKFVYKNSFLLKINWIKKFLLNIQRDTFQNTLDKAILENFGFNPTIIDFKNNLSGKIPHK